MKKKNIFLMFILLLFTACSNTQNTPKGLERFRETRNIPENMALIYFFKPKVETGTSTKVLVNSIELANMSAGDYFPVYVPKGEVLLQAKRIGLFSKSDKNKIVYLEEGKTYFIGIGVRNEKSYIIPVSKKNILKAKTELISYKLKKPIMTKLPLDESLYELTSSEKKKLISSTKVKSIDTGLELLVEQLTDKISEKPKQNIAILPFRSIGRKDEEIELFLSEELTTRIALTNKFILVERNLLEKVMSENEFTQSGLVNEKDAVQIGKLLGADMVCTGTITVLKNSIKVNSRIISTKTGRIETVGATSLSRSGF